ncbi:MAG: Gfo/Idh/MocA family oxidoreductase [Chloroflexi bacterium]|nr:Gfo/Idh/MocA family oxidoreductase [Chloroflexota bacterium]
MRRVIQVGVGGYGAWWLPTVLGTADRAAYVALVDSDPAALAAAATRAGLPERACFTTLAAALDTMPADLLLCVVPPAAHEAVIVPALSAGLHVLSEKPVADSLDATRRIAAAARRGPGSLTIAQKGRYHLWVRRFHAALTDGAIGRLNHVTLHYRAPLFRWGASRFRHRMADPLLVEMSIHHFDLLRALLGRDATAVTGRSWNWDWSDFAGDVAASLIFTMAGGVPVVYEANCISAGDLTSWYGDIRAEGETGTLTMVWPRLTIARRGADQVHVAGLREDLMAVTDPQAGQDLLWREYLDALDTGRPAETAIDDNLSTMAMLFAAIDACHLGGERRIADYL